MGMLHLSRTLVLQGVCILLAVDLSKSYVSSQDKVWANPIVQFRQSDGVSSISISHDGAFLTTACSREVWSWDVCARKKLRVFQSHTGVVNSLSTTRDFKHLATGGSDRKAIIWELATGRKTLEVRDDSEISSVTIAPDGEFLITAGRNCKVWQAKTGQLKCAFADTSTWATAIIPQKELLFCGNIDGTTRAFSIATRKEVMTFRGESTAAISMGISKRGTTIVTGGMDGTARIWDIPSGKLIGSIKCHNGPMFGMAFVDNDKVLVTGGEDRSIRFWDVANRQKIGDVACSDAVLSPAIWLWAMFNWM